MTDRDGWTDKLPIIWSPKYLRIAWHPLLQMVNGGLDKGLSVTSSTIRFVNSPNYNQQETEGKMKKREERREKREYER